MRGWMCVDGFIQKGRSRGRSESRRPEEISNVNIM